MNTRDVEISNSVLSFSEARKIKSTLIILSALALFLFVVLPFYMNNGEIIYGFETFHLISNFDFFNNIDNFAFDIRVIILLFQFSLIVDVVISLFTSRIYDLKIFYLTSLMRHGIRFFLAASLLGACLYGGFIFNSLYVMVLIALFELIFDFKVIRHRVYERYTYDYPFRFMFFTTLMIAYLTLTQVIQKGSILKVFLPQSATDEIHLILIGSSILIFISIFIHLALTITFGLILRSYKSKMYAGFDFWRVISTLFALLILISTMISIGSPKEVLQHYIVAGVLTFIQLIVAIHAKCALNRTKSTYEFSIQEKPWLAKYEEDSWNNLSILPTSIALVSLYMCFISVYQFVDGYSLYNLVIPKTAEQVIPSIGHGPVVKIFAFLTVLLCFANLVLSIATMYIKENKLFEVIRFTTVFIISLITYIVILAGSSKVVLIQWPLIILFVVNGLAAIGYFLKFFVLNKKKVVVEAN